MAFGVTTSGFKRKTYAEILESLESSARAKFGNNVDLSVYAPEGAFLAILAESLDEQWQLAEDIYYGAFLETSEGVSLDRVVSIGGMKRQAEKKSLVTIEFSGDVAAQIAIGMIVGTPQNVQFETIESGTIPVSGLLNIVCRALVSGPDGIVSANSITEIVTPAPGINSLTNPAPSSGGKNRELDVELRARYRERGIAGGSSIPAIEAAIANVAGVISVIAYENATHIQDIEGRPPNSIEVLVLGSATNQDIATAIYNTKPAGIELIGLISYIMTDGNNEQHTLLWNVPVEVQTYIVYQVVSNINWNESSRITIKTNSVIHVGGVDTIGPDSTEYIGVGVGNDVYTWRLEAEQSLILGMESIEATVGFQERLATQAIQSIGIPSSKIARYNVTGTPFGSVVVGDILHATGCTDALNNGSFVVSAVGSNYLDVRNDRAVAQAGIAGDFITIIGSVEKADLTSRQVAKTSTDKIGVTLL